MGATMPKSDETLEDIQWAKFWETPGILSAEVIAGRLRAEGIPAWVWQQGAGTAMGLTFGPMGRGHVMVPEEQLETARRIMALDLTHEDDGGEGFWQDQDIEDENDRDGDGWLSKAVFALTALAVSPLGVAVAFVVAKLFAGQEDEGPICPDCETMVDLDETEIIQGWFICPECERTVLLKK
jgi:hypothetical protein